MPHQRLIGGRRSIIDNQPVYEYGDDTSGDGDLRSMRDDYGTPSVNIGPTQLSQDGILGRDNFHPIRGRVPQWQPGEFEEWKHAKMSGGSTAYGRMAQQQYKSRNIPGMASLMQQGQAQAEHPGITALMNLMKGRR